MLLLVYLALAWAAHRHKSPTYDEPYHAAAAWTHLRLGDYRVDAEDPPLWQLYSVLPVGRDQLKFDAAAPLWMNIPRLQGSKWAWCEQVLYRTPGNSAERIIGRQQVMMVAAAVLLGATIAAFAIRAAGNVAGIVALFLFTFDPLLLGHGPLVKNDVVFSLGFLGLSCALWRLGRRWSAFSIVLVVVATTVMLTVKFSGVLAAALVPGVLLTRALLPWPWGRFTTRGLRLTAAAGVVLLTAVGAYGGIWAVYGFRFSPTPDPAVMLNTEQLTEMARSNEYVVAHDGELPTPAQLAAWPLSLNVRLVRAAETHHLFPQSFLAGLLFTYQSALARPTYLLGRLSLYGHWYYFPLAMLMKTPLATLAAWLAAGAVGAAMLWRRQRSTAFWTAFCIGLPVAMYMGLAMRSNLNIGLRHVMPVYPLLFVATGCVAAAALRRWRRTTLVTLSVLGLGLMTESLSAFPDYIAFFNTAAGGSRGGIRLLGDSNLDWGQDLPALLDWQHAHPTRRLYLAYFGLADPASYGIRYTPLPGGFQFDSAPAWPSGQCTIAVSATYFQGILVDPKLYVAFYRRLASRTPTAVLGGTIYLFDVRAE